MLAKGIDVFLNFILARRRGNDRNHKVWFVELIGADEVWQGYILAEVNYFVFPAFYQVITKKQA